MQNTSTFIARSLTTFYQYKMLRHLPKTPDFHHVCFQVLSLYHIISSRPREHSECIGLSLYLPKPYFCSFKVFRFSVIFLISVYHVGYTYRISYMLKKNLWRPRYLPNPLLYVTFLSHFISLIWFRILSNSTFCYDKEKMLMSIQKHPTFWRYSSTLNISNMYRS